MLDIDQILSLVKKKGPVIPINISKEIKSNTIFVGAALSELASSKKVVISHVKIGGSPLYYTPEQAYKLQEFSKYLNEKDQQAYNLIRQQRIIRDIEQTPLTRVALRNIKDYAKPITVKFNESTEIFWRWYLTPVEEAQKAIQNTLAPKKTEPQKPKPEVPKQIAEQQVVQKQIEEPKKEIRKAIEQSKPIQQKAVQTRIGPIVKYDKGIDDPLLMKTKKYFNERNIKIIESSIIRRNSEIDMVVEIPTPVGNFVCYTKVRDKKKCTDGDIASAYLQGQVKKLPVLYLSTGALTKKAEALLATEFKGLKYGRI